LPQGCDSAARQVLDRVSRIHSFFCVVIFPRRFFSFFHALSSDLLSVCLSLYFLVILVFSAERVASIARVNSARRRNNNFGGSVSCGTTRTSSIQRRSKLEAGKNERRRTQNCKKQNRVTRDTAPGQASPREAPLAPHPLPDRARTNRARAANGAPRRATRPTRPAQRATRELSSCSTESSIPPPLDQKSARRPPMTHARP